MADLPKVRKDADDLSKPERRRSWATTLTSALTAIAASIALGSLSALPTQAIPRPAVGGSSIGALKAPARLVFQPNVPNVQSADHYSHESHFSHESHGSHYSHYSGFQG